MSTALVPVAEADVLERQAATLMRVRQVRARLDDAPADELQEAIVWADAVDAAATLKRAADLAREASELRVLAQRRLGELLKKDAQLRDQLDLTHGGARRLTSLADVPKGLFKRALAGDGPRTLGGIISRARQESLHRVEHGVMQAFDGTYFVKSHFNGRWIVCPTLEAARSHVARSKNRDVAKLDELFARARRLAQEISITCTSKKWQTVEIQSALSKAELKQAEVAELLHLVYSQAKS